MHARPRVAPLLLLALLAAPFATAQLAPGDLLVADLGVQPGLYAVTPAGALATTLLRTGPDYPNAIAERSHAGGLELLVAMVGLPDRLLALTPSGVATTLLPIPGVRPNGLAPDPDGSWRLSASGTQGLLRFDPTARSISTLWKNPFAASVNSVAVNQDTGHYAVALFGYAGPRVVELDRGGALAVTLDSSIRDISSIAWDPSTGTYTLTDFVKNDPAEFVRLDPVRRTVTSLVSPSAAHDLNAQARTRRGTSWLAGGNLLYSGTLHEVVPGGAVLRSFPLPWPNAAPSAIAQYGASPLGTSGRAAPGGTFFFHLASALPSDRNKPYALLLSLSSRPGIPLPDGRTLELRFDPITAWGLLGALAPFFGSGSNVGVLDGAGRATARLTLPAWVPPATGVRLFAAFGTIDSAAPSGIGTVSNTVGFTVE
ncbi:MAG: hypothetical protein JXQ29_01800 [Planctomycetes bacterium]|nr:hypothetical protein [Planctomycetota bacterium]